MKAEHIVKVEAGEFTLAYNLRACAMIEGQFPGRGLQSILNDLSGDDPKMGTLEVVIWAGLTKHHAISRDEAGELVQLNEIGEWVQAIGAAMGGGQADKVDRPQKAAKAR
ncbi:hypothetical protein [Pelagibacterium sp.]|uniref:hypothetical protein n=1 Tax=Pelagibacterium sp. TaxID=1967288 RepID=UPI002D802C68|nr:hypothetical protein [Pelagibacterium sp.]